MQKGTFCSSEPGGSFGCRLLREFRVPFPLFSGERLFKCDVCGKHFATNEYLKCHKRCHMGVKPYKCEVCGKTFGLRASLAQHSNVHAGNETVGAGKMNGTEFQV